MTSNTDINEWEEAAGRGFYFLRVLVVGVGVAGGCCTELCPCGLGQHRWVWKEAATRSCVPEVRASTGGCCHQCRQRDCHHFGRHHTTSNS